MHKHNDEIDVPATKLIVAKEKAGWQARHEKSVGTERRCVYKVLIQPWRAHASLCNNQSVYPILTKPVRPPTCMFAKIVDCQSRLSSNLSRIAARHHGSESYASRGRRPGVSGVDKESWPAYDGDFRSNDRALFAVFSLGARVAFVLAFPLMRGTEILGRAIYYFVRC